MESVLRPLAIFIILLVIFRVSGKRTMTETTPFDMVLLLIISETVQQALIDDDHSMTNAILLIITLVLADVGISMWKQRSKSIERLIEGSAIIIVEDGKLLKDRMERARIGTDDILQAARELQGLERVEQIKFAVLEKSGTITVIPKEK
jgi:uncharacterized membrane protein YcaP (DUF421 family)